MLFETPFSPCDTFRGREAILNIMETYFHPLEGTSHEQMSFAICGLGTKYLIQKLSILIILIFTGGSGKTQTALQYALRNRYRYKSGVFFFNAGSDTTLAADFARVFDLLEISGVSNKTDAVKRWLSGEENPDWLLIFDNADNLDSVQVRKYFPMTLWGHIVLTSRDQAAIGSVAKQGYLLEPLEADEAIEVLLEKAGIKEPLEAELQEAKEIVELLGCLPLAVDQGGAFIKSRRKTLTDYRRLYGERQLEVLKFKPRLGEYDRTVFTTWEMNFEQVVRDSKEASDLLLLFCFLDGSGIPERMLSRGSSPQPRWSSDGEKVDVTAEDDGLDSSLVALIKDEMAFDDAIEKLLSFSLIHWYTNTDGSRSFSVHPLVQYCASQRVSPTTQLKWRLQAIYLVCHAFPRNKYLEPL